MDGQRELSPPYVRYLARIVRPFPNWDFIFIRSLRRKAVKALRLKAGNRVLDAGCGSGGSFPFLENSVGSSGEIVGIEISPEAAINARKRIDANHWSNVHVIVGDAKTVQLSGLFDGLVMFAAPDVYASPEAVANLFEHLKPGARVVIFGPKLSHHHMSALPNSMLRLMMKLSFKSTPALTDWPLSIIQKRVTNVRMDEIMLGSMFLASASVV